MMHDITVEGATASMATSMNARTTVLEPAAATPPTCTTTKTYQVEPRYQSSQKGVTHSIKQWYKASPGPNGQLTLIDPAHSLHNLPPNTPNDTFTFLSHGQTIALTRAILLSTPSDISNNLLPPPSDPTTIDFHALPLRLRKPERKPVALSALSALGHADPIIVAIITCFLRTGTLNSASHTPNNQYTISLSITLLSECTILALTRLRLLVMAEMTREFGGTCDSSKLTDLTRGHVRDLCGINDVVIWDMLAHWIIRIFSHPNDSFVPSKKEIEKALGDQLVINAALEKYLNAQDGGGSEEEGEMPRLRKVLAGKADLREESVALTRGTRYVARTREVEVEV